MNVPGFTDLTEIGRGGFGVVYRAPQAGFGRDVAIKVLSAPSLKADERARRRFERETATTGSLSSHPHIVTLHQAGFTEDNQPYLVMALMEGGSLGDRLEQSGPLEVDEVTAIGVKIAGALATAHAAGIIHRDVKPDNILVDDFASPVLSDFGIASASGIDGATLTATGQLTVTIAYSPPEVLDGARPDERTDVFALGATMYALLTGHPPFVRPDDQSVAQIMARLVTEDAPNLVAHGVPQPIADAIARALTRAHPDRTPNAIAFGQQLQNAQTSLRLPRTAMVLPQQLEGGREAERTLALPGLPLHGPGEGDATADAPLTEPLGQRPETTPTASLGPATTPVSPAPVEPTPGRITTAPVPAHPAHHASPPPTPVRAARIGPAIVGILVGLALLSIGAVVVLLTGSDDPPDVIAAPDPASPQAATPADELAGTPNDLTPATAAPTLSQVQPDDDDAPDVVVLSDDAAAQAASQTLQQWHDGINDGNYQLAFAAYTQALQTRVTFARFAEGNQTSQILAPSVVQVTPSDDAFVVLIGFRSLQDSEFGPDGLTCADWSLDWRMVWVGDRLLVDDVDARPGTPVGC